MSKPAEQPGQLRIHLDPVGGVAGDMFIAAVLDAFPGLHDGLVASVRAAGLPAAIGLTLEAHRDHALTGLRFSIEQHPHESEDGWHHRSFRDIRQQLEGSDLAEDVCARAVAIFTLLAGAEAEVHGMDVDDVSFHELGEWDSIADIVGAAFLICEMNATWSVGPLPLGRGRVNTAHGPLPVPAPATALLLEGFECIDDGVHGERVTPTGAAILRHLGAGQSRSSDTGKLLGSGTGFGTQQLAGLSNVLRLLAFEQAQVTTSRERIAEILFEIDDQTPEDLAIGLDRLRAHPAVKDVLQLPAFGKKGRMTTHIRVLADSTHVRQVCNACLQETTTIGLRYQVLDRITLQRRNLELDVNGRSIRVKTVNRDAEVTVKVEADDISPVSGGHSARSRLRRSAEDQFMAENEN